jgi:hypothetical protein
MTMKLKIILVLLIAIVAVIGAGIAWHNHELAVQKAAQGQLWKYTPPPPVKTTNPFPAAGN